MIRKHYGNHGDSGSYSQKNSNKRQRSEQHGRGANNQGNSRNQKQEDQNFHQKASELRSRNNSQQRGYSRDRSKETVAQRQRYPGSSGRSHESSRNKSEETIEDIKQDIIRLEKEIDLEIKEIRSLKL
jgi:hypothetical protein